MTHVMTHDVGSKSSSRVSYLLVTESKTKETDGGKKISETANMRSSG